MNGWNILYRGSLTSCNYGCGYCPFAKTTNTRTELEQDAVEVNRFVDWIEQQSRSIGVLFTPWGEAIIHRYYRQAIIRLSQMPHVRRVSVQTNLSCNLQDFAEADPTKFTPWATFHPGEVAIDRFLERCRQLDKFSIRYSVGVVGLREHFVLIEQLRELLEPSVYLWVNCYKQEPAYYAVTEVDRLRKVDPYFDLNRHYYPSLGKPCLAGDSTFTVDGAGDARRCHFIDECIGNIYEPGFTQRLEPRLCTNRRCGCHIGYVHRPELKLYDLYGEGILARIPATWPTQDERFLTPGVR